MRGRGKSLENKYLHFVKELETGINDLCENYTNVVILCIGTIKIVGDSVGPLIGENIKNMENKYIQVYGTIKKTINFNNAKILLTEIFSKYKNPYVITIDAALANKESIGKIFLNKGYIKIGKALEKSICFYSNLNVKCVVGENTNSKMQNLIELKNVNEKEVRKIANMVSWGLERVLENKKIWELKLL